MKITDPRVIDPAVETQIADMLRGGRDPDEVIAQMRAFGLHNIECIKLLRNYGGMKLGEVKDVVHLSPAWADRYEYDEALHDAAEQALAIVLAEEDKLTAA